MGCWCFQSNNNAANAPMFSMFWHLEYCIKSVLCVSEKSNLLCCLEITIKNPHFRMKHEDRITFINDILKWMEGSNPLKDQRCFILSFGYMKPFPFPDVKLSSDFEFPKNIGTFHVQAFPNKCSIVVIGGKYLQQVDEVMRTVDKITKDRLWMPYAVFLMTEEKPGQDIKFTVSTRHRRSPTMYQVPATRSSVVQFVMTCPGMSHSSTHTGNMSHNTKFTLHMRDNGMVDNGKRWDDLCEKTIDVAYRNAPYFGVWNYKIVRFHTKPVHPATGISSYIPYDYEILKTFLQIHKIFPYWINCGWEDSVYDADTGKWTGQVGKVRVPSSDSMNFEIKQI